MKTIIKNKQLKIILLCISSLYSVAANARPTGASCPIGQTITRTFSSGAKWDMCWETRNEEGIVLSDIYYKPVGKPRRRILGEASLSQIQTEYDDGSTTEFLVTDAGKGLGGQHLQTLTAETCGGTLHREGGRNVLCEDMRAAGYIYRYKNSIRRQGSKMEVYSISAVGSREFIINWTFLENGTIETGVGLTGKFVKTTNNASAGWPVTTQNRIASSFVDHYFWRLDFDIAGDNSNDIVEQIKSAPSASRLTKTKQTNTVSTELSASFLPAEKKFWRIRDQSVMNSANRPISYEMVMLNYAEQNKGNSSSPWLKNDIYITRYKACERFAVQNPTNNGCADNVSAFVNAQNTNAKDIVIWYRMSHHTLPKDEDFSPAIPRWTKFKLLPRDWTSTNRL